MQRRSARIHFVDEGSHDRELSIFLRKDGQYTVGELRLIEQNGSLRQRSVRFTTCSEAVEGLALIATVSLDPQALVENPESVPETPPAPPPPRPTPPLRPRRPKQGATPTEPPAQDSTGLQTRFGAELNGYFNALPQVGLGASLLLDVAAKSRHWLSPLIRGGITHVEALGVPEKSALQTAEANFALSLASLSACPFRIGGDSLVLRPCVSISGGALRSWSTKTNDPQPRTRPYVAWGGSALLFLRLGELVEIVGDAGVGVTVIRDTFTFGGCPSGPNGADCALVLQTPALYVSSGLGVSLLLP